MRLIPGILFFLTVLAAAGAGNGSGGGEQAIDIAAGPAGKTLRELARQTGLQILFQSEMVRGITTRAVRGRMSTQAALGEMLAGTPLKALPDPETGALAIVSGEAGNDAQKPGAQASGPQTEKTDPLQSNSLSTDSMKNENPFGKAFTQVLLAVGILTGPAAPGQTAPVAEEEEVETLTPFSIEIGRDEGYTATQSLAGGRLATPIKDTGAAITVLTREFLDDVAASNFLEAADWAPNSNSAYSASGPNVFNDYQVNFRSLGGGFQSRNYFRWYINSDVYNTSRIDFARGPNSVVFGDAGVGGIANVSSKRAYQGTYNELSFRWHSFDGERATFDFNRALGKKLSVRFAGVYDHSDDWVDQQRIDREGLFLAGTWEPTSKTQIRGELEWGQVDRVVGFFPFDAWSNWDGTTTVSAPLTSGNFTGGLGRYTADTLVYSPSTPEIGIINWRNWGQTTGSVRQLLVEPLEHAPVRNPTIDRLSKSFQSPDATAQNPYGVGSLFIEQQVGENLFLEVAGNYQEQYRDVTQHFAQSIQHDVNTLLPNGQPNPNFGKRYTQDRRREQDQSNKVYEWRASAAYLLANSWMEQRLLVSGGQRYDRFDSADFELVRTNGTDKRLNQAANRINTRQYEDNLKAGLGMPMPSGDPSGIQSKYAQLSGLYNDNELSYIQAAASGSWLSNKRLKTIVAVRTDYLHVERAASLTDPVTAEWVRFGAETEDPDVDVTTYTGGVVYTITDAVNAFVNYAESFQPASAALGINGEGIAPLTSEGVDAGVRLTLFGGKVTGSVSYYVNEEINRRRGGRATQINAIWDDLLSSEEVQTGYNDTFSQKGSGWELDFTANLTRSWRLLFNLAIPETETIDGHLATKNYYDQHIATWRAGAAAQTDPNIATRINNNIASIENFILSANEGRELNGAYGYTANFYTNYTLNEGRWKGLGFGGGVQARGDRLVTNLPNLPFEYIYADSYYLVTGAVSYKFKVWDNPMRLQLNVSNLLDDELIQPTRYSNYTVNSVTQYVPDRYYIQPPRRFTVTATYEF